tara:strand:+ start:490 stop:600 length:111 start_codon:yes stop_codon:yes gene_type:complete
MKCSNYVPEDTKLNKNGSQWAEILNLLEVTKKEVLI